MGAGPYPTEIHGALAEELREVGAEYGTTTGRPRRIGWLDMVALKFATRINGLTHLNLTKLDVLSGLAEIRVGVGYRAPGGALLPSVPADLELLEKCEVGRGGGGGEGGRGAAARACTRRRRGARERPAVAHACPLSRTQVVYETLPGWQQDISKVRSWDELPENARR